MPLTRVTPPPSTLRHGGAFALVCALALACPLHVAAQPGAATRAAVNPPAEDGVRWQDLKPEERTALKPLEREWPGIDAVRKQKWLELSARVPSMSADERARVQGRMADWARLTPQERGRARLNFEEAKATLPRQDRKARWEAYQSLPAEEKRELAERAKPPATASPARAPVANGDAARRNGVAPTGRPDRAVKADRDVPQAKSNIVPNPAFSAPPKPVAPTVLQAQPGATTTLITKRPTPPSHQQTGMPKIAATPEFVDKATLLPQRGPQGAAARSTAASEPPPPPPKRR